MKKTLLMAMVVMGLLFTLPVFATAVSEMQARTVAQAWLAENRSFSGRVADDADVRAEVNDAGETLWYEVATEGGGCVVTSSDTSLEPVIAYVERWPEEMTKDNPLYVMLKTDLENRLDVISGQASGGLKLSTSSTSSLQDSIRKAASKWARLNSKMKLTASSTTSITPSVIVSWIPEWRLERLTHWNQNENASGEHCYDYYTPNYYPCGCVATAGAALLQYYNLTKAPSLTNDRCWVDGTKTSLTTKGVDYDWMNTSNELYGRAAYDVGVCIGMSYKSDGSSASTYTLAQSLKNNFGLTSATYVSISDASQYHPYIYAQNRSGAPVVLSIQRSGGGHAVLAVGYAEDTEGAAYTRVFMGWGGYSDAWYALPSIGRYTAISAVVTAMGPDDKTAAICGRVKTDAGDPLAFADVSYDGINAFVTDANGFWAGRVSQDGKSHTIACAGVSQSVDIGSSVTSLPSDTIDLVVPATSLPLVYEDAETAQVRAMASGRLVFVLNGATWCGYCTKIKTHIADLGQSFEDRYTYLWHDRDINKYGLATYPTPSFGCFDPRNFDIANKFESHASRFCYCGGYPGSSSGFNSYLSSAEEKWAKLNTTPVSVDLGSSDVISGVTELKAKATFSDGVTSVFTKDVKWKIVAGTVATLDDGMLNPKPGATGSVVLMGEATVKGENYAFFHKVNITGGVALTGIAIEGPDTLDLYDAATAAFSIRASYSDGKTGKLDATWSLDASAPSTAMISEGGVLSFTSYRKMEDPFQIIVKATCGGFTDSRCVTVTPPGSLQKVSGVFDKNAIWPNAHLTFTPTYLQWKRHNVIEAATASLNDVSVEWYADGEGSTYNKSTNPNEVTVPSSVGSSSSVCGYFEPSSGRSVDYGYIGTSPGVNVYSSEPTWVTVTFDTGGLQSIPSVKYPAGGKYMLLPSIAKTGYYTYWYTDDGTEVDTYNSIVPSSSHTLHARLSPTCFYVCFNANDGTSSSISKWYYWNANYTFPSKPFSRAGYTFEGWATSADGEVVYADATEVYNWYCVYKNIQLYAVWTPLDPVSARVEGPDALLGSSAQLNVGIGFSEGEDMSLTNDIAWTLVSGSAATISSAGVLTPVAGQSGTVVVGASLTFRGKAFAVQKALQIFDADDVADCWIEGKDDWFPRVSKETLRYSLVVSDVAGNEYALAADSWSATWEPTSSSDSTDFQTYFTLSDVGVLGCVSIGRGGVITLTAMLGDFSASKDVRTYRCARVDKWIPRPASSVLYPGAQVQMNDEFVVRLANGDEVERLAYSELDVFSTYFTSSQGSNLFDAEDAPSIANDVLSVPTQASCSPDDGLVYFQPSCRSLNSDQYYYQYYYGYLNNGAFPFAWYDTKPTLIDVTFDANGGLVDERAEITRSYAASKTYKTLPKPVRLGYTFSGWYTAKSGGTAVTTESTASSSAHTLYARWASGTFWVYLGPNGGDGTYKWVSVSTAEYATGNLPANTFTRTGYVFDGWSLSQYPSYTEGNYFADCAPLSSLPAKSGYTYLYAIWRPIGDSIPVPQSDVSVPKMWMDRYTSLLSANGNDYVKTLKAKAANGRSVYECYVAGLDPEDPNDDFVLDISMENGVPILDFSTQSRRSYTIWGSDDLKSWHKIESSTEGDYNFFKVTVELK